ncbi:MAG: hypothetical protein NC293_07590 [Roseburia sp.]|nr:hypothetical protein [Roseburia sp.]
MAVRSNNGISRLAGVMDRRMNQQSETPLLLDFGTVKKNGSLLTNTFPKTIAKGDYTILEGFEHKGKDTRVLVAWVEDDAVVIGKLVDS